MSRNEANTRKEFIDRALQTGGWNLEDPNQVGIEIPVDGYDAEPWNGVTDYCLYQPNGEAIEIAVVEAKRQSRDPRVAEQQVRRYVTEIEKHQRCLSSKLRAATPEQFNRIIADWASQMKNRPSRPNSFVEIDLRDRIAVSGYITLGEGGEQVYIEEYRQRVEGKGSEIVETHPTIAAIRNGEEVTDLQLVALKRTLPQELEGRNLQLSELNIRKAFNLKFESFLAFLREFWKIE